MITRAEVLSDACEKCLKEFYELVVPKVTWDEFLKENQAYSDKCKEWEHLHIKSSYKTYCGPCPFEFYYLPKEIMKDICDSYISAYNIDSQQELLNIIEILKNYCKEPIVDKWIEEHTDENGDWHPGYRSYDNPNNLGKEIRIILEQIDPAFVDVAEEIENKFFEFLDMAGKFYNWNRDLNSFNMSIYLGPTPNSNKESVIENWKKYRNQDIEINEEQIKKNYYGEDELD